MRQSRLLSVSFQVSLFLNRKGHKVHERGNNQVHSRRVLCLFMTLPFVYFVVNRQSLNSYPLFTLRRQGEPKGATLADLALHSCLPPQFFHDAPHNG